MRAIRNLTGQQRAAMFYFCYMAAIGSTAPFLYLVYRQHGLTPIEIGIAIAVAHVMNFVTAPVWGAVNDLRQHHKDFPLLTIACFGAGLAILLLNFAYDLLPILAAIIVWGFFAGSIISLADASTILMLGENKHHYGRVRVWGSLGGVVASLLVGLMGNQVGLRVLFPVYSLMMLLCAGLAFTFPRAHYEVKPFIREGAAHLMRDRRVPFFLLSIFVLAVAYMGWRGTFSLYLEDMSAKPGLIGAFFAISSAIEIPLIASSSVWLKRFGARSSLLVSFSIFTFFWIGCSLIGQPALALPLALVHGVSYGIYDVAGVVYIGQVAPKGYTSFAQGMYGGINRGLGSIAGSLAGGYLFQTIGGESTYRISALLGLLALGCLFFLAQARKPSPNVAVESI